MPGPETRPLFDLAQRARGRVLSRLCRADPGEGRGAALQHLDPGRSRRPDRRPLPQDPPAGPFRASAARRRSSISKSAISMSATRASRCGASLDAVIGMCICNDRRWPETYRVMGLQGVEIVALGYNTPIENIHHREPEHLRMFHHLLSMQADAYQNARLGAGGGEMRRGGRVRHDRRLGDRRADRRDRRPRARARTTR